MTEEINGAKLKELRKSVHMSLMEVDKTGIVSSSYLSQIETGQVKNPSYDLIMKLLKLYHVNVSIDFEGIDNEK